MYFCGTVSPSIRLILALLALLLGWLTPVHAVPPPVPAPIEIIAPVPDQAQPDVIIYLAAYRANGPPTAEGRAPVFFVVCATSGRSAWWNLYAYCGGDPVNRADPSGLDEVWISGGTVYWQRENPGTLWDPNVGQPIAIGTTDDNQWIRINKQHGGGLVDYGTLKYHARKTYSGRAGETITDQGMAAIVQEARGDGRNHEYMPWIRGAEGALRVAYEPVGLVKTGLYALGSAATMPFGGRRVSSNDLRRDGFFPDSSLFSNAAQRLDEGTSRTRVGFEVGRDIFTRGNPATGIPLAAFDVYQGSREGDHARVGGAITGLAMYAAPIVPKARVLAKEWQSIRVERGVSTMQAVNGKIGIILARRQLARSQKGTRVDDMRIEPGQSSFGITPDGWRAMVLGTNDANRGIRHSMKAVLHEYGHAHQWNILEAMQGSNLAYNTWMNARANPSLRAQLEYTAELFAIQELDGAGMATPSAILDSAEYMSDFSPGR